MRQVLVGLVFAALLQGGGAVFAESEGSWREEFDRICARTGEVDGLSETELNQLIFDSEELRKKIAVSGASDSKVYLFRIGKCRDFFVFMKNAAATARLP